LPRNGGLTHRSCRGNLKMAHPRPLIRPRNQDGEKCRKRESTDMGMGRLMKGGAKRMGHRGEEGCEVTQRGGGVRLEKGKEGKKGVGKVEKGSIDSCPKVVGRNDVKRDRPGQDSHKRKQRQKGDPLLWKGMTIPGPNKGGWGLAGGENGINMEGRETTYPGLKAGKKDKNEGSSPTRGGLGAEEEGMAQDLTEERSGLGWNEVPWKSATKKNKRKPSVRKRKERTSAQTQKSKNNSQESEEEPFPNQSIEFT